MKIRASVFVPMLCLMVLVGCAAPAQKSPPLIPDPTIASAAFKVDAPYTVIIRGEFFKTTSDNKKDVVVSLNGANWTPATSISESSLTKYVAVIPYGISFPQVWVRVYGMDEEYSQPFLVHGQRRGTED